jgi:hypothetical protein
MRANREPTDLPRGKSPCLGAQGQAANGCGGAGREIRRARLESQMAAGKSKDKENFSKEHGKRHG